MKRVRKEREKFLANCIEGRAGLVILDAGCGDGWFGEVLGRDNFVVALDIDEEAACQVRGDLVRLPLSDNTVDVIWCSQVLEHIKDDEAALAEMGRVAKKDGLLIIGVPNEGCLLGQLRNQVLQRWILQSTEHVHFYRVREMREKLHRAGWQVVRVWRKGFFTPHTGLHRRLNSHGWGFKLLQILGVVWRSQAAGMYFVGVRRGPGGLTDAS